MKDSWKLLAAASAVVIGVYASMAHSGAFESLVLKAADSHYNLLVRGFRRGHLNLEKEVPPGLMQLADPYDPTANALYRSGSPRMHDLSYYKGRLYLYFGVTPALILFWPFTALTGLWLFNRQAVVILCAIGFLASVVLLRALWRRYFAQVSVWVVAACALALGLATGVPMLLSRCEVYEVAISCGYMLTMLALGAIWCAFHEPRTRSGWLAAASVAYGLAVGAMPNLLFGAAILLVPVLQARRERQKVWIPLMAATGPIILIGLGLMLYNAMRFDNPFEFGMRYQLAARRQVTERFFSLHYLWFNFRVYFLQPVHWSSRFPFVNDITVPPLPEGHGPVESPFGVLTNIPLVWLALAVPLAWRGRSGPAASILRWFVMTVALLFGICALTLGPCIGANFRYEVEFLPALVLLAVIGIFGLERALAPTLASNRIRGQDSGLAGRPVWRRAVRWGWGLLLGFSVSFNLLANVAQYAETLNGLGLALVQSGRFQDAIWHYEQALRIRPDYAEPHNNLGNAFGQVGNLTEAIAHYEQALRIKPEYAEAHCNLGATLGQAGRMPEAIEHLEHALRIKPDYAEAHNNLALAFRQLGNLTEAIAHYEQALRIKPDYAEAHCNLGATLGQAGRMPEAIEHLEHALRIKPDYAEAHYNLGVTLEQAGRVREAIGHYEQALRIKPDFAQAQNALAKLQARQ